MNTKDKSKLNGKDLISIGIFTAVYFILNLLIAAARGFIPLVNMMIPFASSLVLGIPMMLYFSKIKKFGMVLITYIIYGAILTLAGVGIYSLNACTICALIAEFILKAKRYASISAAILSYAVCSVGANANVLGFAFMTEAQLAEKTAYYGQEYMDIISGYFSHGYMLPLLAITAFAGGALGGLLHCVFPHVLLRVYRCHALWSPRSGGGSLCILPDPAKISESGSLWDGVCALPYASDAPSPAGRAGFQHHLRCAGGDLHADASGARHV